MEIRKTFAPQGREKTGKQKNEKKLGAAEKGKRLVQDTLNWTETVLRMPPIKTEIIRDPKDANAPGQAMTEAQAKAESNVFNALDASTREKFEQLKQGIGGDPAARAALSRLLTEGRLSEDLLESLLTLDAQPLAPGIDGKALLADALEEIEDPATINQQKQNTCGATSAQIFLAKSQPTEYLRLLSGLASPEGKVLTRGGDEIERKEDWSAEDGGRTLSSRLLQPAFMELSNGKLTYDNTKDWHSRWKVPVYPGVMPDDEARLMTSLTGRKYESDFTLFQKEKTVSSLKPGPGKEIPVVLNYQNKPPIAPAHWMLLTEIKDGYAHFLNPYGWEERMTMEEFQKNLLALVQPE